ERGSKTRSRVLKVDERGSKTRSRVLKVDERGLKVDKFSYIQPKGGRYCQKYMLSMTRKILN
ncbi:hypothetical protein, partial [Nostoc sp.]|uniref:hypothetical protein n=1 Tax=Nostoc sp. TaxID=1180 RepID=UPI002FF842FC